MWPLNSLTGLAILGQPIVTRRGFEREVCAWMLLVQQVLQEFGILRCNHTARTLNEYLHLLSSRAENFNAI